MRLFLSSYRAGKYDEQLVELFGQASRVAVVSNAKDYKSETERRESIAAVLNWLTKLGFSAKELDLRQFFEIQHDWRQYLSEYDAIWLAGGNTFVLRRALAKSRLDQALTYLVRNDGLPYGGESAGAIMATPDFTGVQYGDNPNILPKGYVGAAPWVGLGLINYCIVPHFQSAWAGSEQMIAALRRNKKIFKTLTDDQAITINGANEKLLG